MLIKRTQWAATLAVAALLTGGASAQGVLTVSKNNNPDADAGMFNSIQAAVNAAKPGQIIQIEDTETYEEQVTIDGRDVSPWDKYNGGPEVKGGKNGITIRSKNPTSLNKPVIKWKDTQNQSPKNAGEAGKPGELLGTSGNFETCGALRIIRAQGVTIDGITVDGGGAAPFGWGSVWGGKDPLFHGNAAITLAVASGAVIRNCELRNAYFGVNVKDRNIGGVFGNPNPADNDQKDIIPLSGFGDVGNHLIEHNRIWGNSLAFFFESAWDLGSTVRYNLVYSNFHTAATKAEIARIGIEAGNRATGAFLFKDLGYSPVAIYNNTFYNNYANFYADWKAGAPHLIFNNIYGRSSDSVGTRLQYVDAMGIDHKFPYRMNNCLFSALADLKAEKVHVSGCSNTTINPPIYGGQEVLGITQVRISNSFPTPTVDGLTTVNCLAPIQNQTATTDRIIPHGSRIAGGTSGIPASAELRWLETSRSVDGTEDLFVSTNPTSADFLRPKWDHPLVSQYIKNKGWMTTHSTPSVPGAGIRNSDGSAADIGAIPSTGKVPASVARIKPSYVVLVNGTSADASFYITLEGGQFNNPKIRFLRWVTPLPAVGDADWGASAVTPVPSAAIRNITPPNTVLNVGNNSLRNITIPALTANDTLGFFELTVEGTDASGNQVTSDVGFLPYRNLNYFLKIEVFPAGTGPMTEATRLKTVTAGEPYRVRVSPLDGTRPYAPKVTKVDYSLLSDPTAQMWRQISPEPGNPLLTDRDVGGPETVYNNIYFTRAGDEVIFGSGLFEQGTQRLPFLGSEQITVLPGAPDKVVFTSPIPKSQIPAGTLAPVIPRGAPTEVLVEVQDRFGNRINAPVDVRIESSNVSVGDVGAAANNMSVKTVKTDGGVASFIALTGPTAEAGNTFDMTATLVSNGRTDVATFRVGRAVDRLEVFYSDNKDGENWKEYFDNEVTIEGNAGEWHRVTVKAVGPETVIASKSGYICVGADDGLKLASGPDGSGLSTTFQMANGQAVFYVSADSDFEGCISNVSMQTSRSCDDGDRDWSINTGNRCGIKFIKPSTAIENAVVFGDGNGRPDSALIRYARVDGAASVYSIYPGGKPDSVSLRWPSGNVESVTATVAAGRITVVDSFTLGVSFRGVNGDFPSGYTAVVGDGRGLLTVWPADGTTFDVLDGIGPVIADYGDGIPDMWSPMIVENLDPENVPDTLIIKVSEQFRDEALLVGLSSIFYSETRNDPATGGTPIGVQAVFRDVMSGASAYKVVLALGGPTRPKADGWIRFNPSTDARDMAASARYGHPDNGAHANNRWVQLKEKTVPPDIVSAWYTSNPITGIQDFVYLTFNKKVDLSWFAGGYFKFGPGSNDQSSVGNYLSIMPGDSMTVVVNLRLAWPGQDHSKVVTSGTLPVAIGANPAQGWEEMSKTAIDRAAPVLVSARLIKGAPTDGGGYDLDTLEVVYSEPPSAAAKQVTQPVVICRGGSKAPVIPIPTLQLVSEGNVRGTSYYSVMYIVADGRTDELQQNDSVYINWDGVPLASQMSDGETPPNYQDVENRNVPLTIVSKIFWTTRVKNNPFFFSTGGANNGATVVVIPRAGGVSFQEVKAKIRLYDNTGNLVIDTTVVSPTADSIVWNWSGHNNRGRMVGTGTYLFKALCDVTEKGATSPVSTERVLKSIGFVRKGAKK